VLFREPSDRDAIGESARDNPIFAAASTPGGSGTLREPLTPGGPVLLTAFHAREHPPLLVAVSLDRDEVLTAWQRDVVGFAAIFGGLGITLGATLVVLYRQMDAKAAAQRELTRTREIEADRLRESNERLAEALEREQGARREAEAASALKDQFLMTVSHELRTPLTAIYGWARMLSQGAVSDRHKVAALRTIERNAHVQTRLIDDLLDVSRVTGGKLRLDVHAVNIAEVVQHAVDTVRPAADARGVHLDSLIDLAAGRVLGDHERLQQIAWNLLSNAVKFTATGGRVVVNVRRVENEVEIVVSDTGIGISPEFLPHVFERFRQEEGGTKRRFGGLGLGLAIVRNLVELHGGTVTAHSDGTGHGSTFTVHLASPAAMAPSPEPATAMTAPHTAPIAATRLDGVRVLVVDDDKESRELFTAILETYGATAIVAESAAEALEIVRRMPPDVLVSDIEMPEMDGYALVQQALVRAHERGQRLGTIAVTAYSRAGDEARSLQAGFQRHLQKPLEPAALVGAVAAVWDDNRISSG
jgi:signal transduction histidine kinase/ActR/RegA family two-component response regulator